MRALVCHEITDDLSGVEIREVDTPIPGDDEVLIKVHATSINFPRHFAVSGQVSAETRTPIYTGHGHFRDRRRDGVRCRGV